MAYRPHDISQFVNESAKDVLARELKDNYHKYMELLRLWFRRKISKAEFDRQARSLFPNSNVATHNRFILSIVSSCRASDSLSRPRQGRVSKSLKFRFKELPQMPFLALISEFKTTDSRHSLFEHGKKDFSVVTTSCVREQCLPGTWMLYGRVMNTLQLYSVQEFTAEALNALAAGTQAQVVRALQCVLASRRCCRLAPPDLAESPSAAASPQQPQASPPNPSPVSPTLADACGVPPTPSSSSTSCLAASPSSTKRRERVAFGRVPIPQLQLSPGYTVAVAAEKFNSLLAWSPPPPPTPDAAGQQAEAVAALLRTHRRNPFAAAAAPVAVADLRRLLDCPDSHVVGYAAVQQEQQAVRSHFLRFLSMSRVMNRLRQQQLSALVQQQLADESESSSSFDVGGDEDSGCVEEFDSD